MAKILNSVIILLLCGHASVYASFISNYGRPSEYFEKQFNKTVECLRHHLVIGAPSIGLPSLSPLKIDKEFNFQTDNKMLWADLKFNNITINRLAAFEITSISLSPLLKLQVNCRFDKVTLVSLYEGDVNFFGLIGFYGRGAINAELYNVFTNITLHFSVIPPLVQNLFAITTLGNAEVTITGDNGDEDTNEYLSKLFSEALKFLVKLLKMEIATITSRAAKKLVNFYVGHYSFLDFLALVILSQC